MPTGYATFTSPNCSRSPTLQNKLMSADQPSGVRLPSTRFDEHVDKALTRPPHVLRTRMRTGRVTFRPYAAAQNSVGASGLGRWKSTKISAFGCGITSIITSV